MNVPASQSKCNDTVSWTSLLIITGTAADIYCIQLANPKRPETINTK